VTEYGFPATIVPRVRFCGVVLNRDEVLTRNEDRDPRGEHARPSVLATVGGGEDGKHILEAFIEASIGAPWDGIVVAGTMMPPADRERIARAAADAELEFHVFLSGLTKWYEQVDAAVCMGGYNTVAEALFMGVPTVCIPRVRPRKEQLIRATALTELGLMNMLHPDQLTVAALREAITRALAAPREQLRRHIDATLDFTGADKAAVELLELANSPAEPLVPSGDKVVR
ncbi:MAG TPA: glycosyltransferase, partial [Chloroflexota bacterium]